MTPTALDALDEAMVRLVLLRREVASALEARDWHAAYTAWRGVHEWAGACSGIAAKGANEVFVARNAKDAAP